jgi:DNA helicase-2/ATP-dependent DNA helicase PcrA
LAILIDLAREHHRVDPLAKASAFAAWAAATLQAEGADRGGDAVVVATFHAAKGLEWPVVHLAGLEDGFIPVGHARTTIARAEEARLLYVAMTRAVRTLSGTWASRRTFNGRTVERRICPWLRDMAQATDEADDGSPQLSLSLGLDWHDHLAEQRRTLERTRPEPSPTYLAALAWRDKVARGARVEPTTILDDALVQAVVAAMPLDHDELVAVPGMGPLLAERIGADLLAVLHHARDVERS